MSWFGKKFAGLEALCKYYLELGIDASILPEDSPESLEKGLVKSDMGYMKINGWNFDLVTIRIRGATSGSYELGTIGLGKVGGSKIGIPVGEKRKIPFEYHHIVRTMIADEDSLKATLKKEKKGFLSKEIASVSWEGRSLASRLNSMSELNRTILSFITPEDELSVESQKKHNVVRIIFSRPSEIRLGLIHNGMFVFDRRMLPKDAIEVINEIAGIVKGFQQRS